MKERLEGMTQFMNDNLDFDVFMGHLRAITDKCVKYDFESDIVGQIDKLHKRGKVHGSDIVINKIVIIIIGKYINEEDFICDPRVLVYMLMKNGTPDNDTLATEAFKLLKVVEYHRKFASVIQQITTYKTQDSEP